MCGAIESISGSLFMLTPSCISSSRIGSGICSRRPFRTSLAAGNRRSPLRGSSIRGKRKRKTQNRKLLEALVTILQDYRILRLETYETPDAKLGKLEHTLSQYRLPLEESVPLFAPLLSL